LIPPAKPPALSIRLLLCALAGAANVFAFAPFGWWPLQIVLLALLLRSVAADPDTGAVLRNTLSGWAYGFGWLCAGFYWLYISMHRYGGMPSWLAILAVILLAAFLGGLYACGLGGATWLQRRWRIPAGIALVFLFPAAWALADWTRGWFFTGFPWLAAGYAHTDSPLAGFAPVIGVYGIGWLAALCAACLALLPARRLPVLVPVALLAAGAGLQQVKWTAPHGRPLSVRLLQGNVPQEMKFDSDKIYETLAMYRDMIEAAPADLVVTPETAITLFLSQLPPDFANELVAHAHTTNTHIVLGIPVTDGAGHYANSAIGIGPQASVDGHTFFYRYDKHHLVPFGEFIPFGFRWFVNMMNMPLGDFTEASTLQPAFRVKDQAVQPNICYEDLFGEEIAAQIRAGRTVGQGSRAAEPTILLNMSNIAWFGDSLALPQHLQISRMRALETGRPMLRATNTGVTAIIDAKGKVSAVLPAYTRNTLAAPVQGYGGATPYVLMGNNAALGLMVLSLLLAWHISSRHRQAPPAPTQPA
jgi:apolipoprotein N-acyltransferase